MLILTTVRVVSDGKHSGTLAALPQFVFAAKMSCLLLLYVGVTLRCAQHTLGFLNHTTSVIHLI